MPSKKNYPVIKGSSRPIKGSFIHPKHNTFRKIILDRLRLPSIFRNEFDQEKYLKSFIIIPDYIDLKSLDTTDFDMLIASICSRVSLDERQLFSKPILTVPEAIEFIQTNKINESDFKFDQFN